MVLHRRSLQKCPCYPALALRLVLALKHDECKALYNRAVDSLPKEPLATCDHRLYILKLYHCTTTAETKRPVQLCRAGSRFLLMCRTCSEHKGTRHSLSSLLKELPPQAGLATGSAGGNSLTCTLYSLTPAALPLQTWAAGYVLH